MIRPPDNLVACLREHERFLITSHRSPDGDALGASLALGLALRELGKTCEVVNTDGVPHQCRFLPAADTILRTPRRNDAEVAVIVDVDDSNLERVAAPPASLRRCPVHVVIDHHATGRVDAPIHWIDTEAAATGMLIHRLALLLPDCLTAEVAQCLYAAIATDTGAFRFVNTSAEVLSVAADLVRRGADPSETARHLFEVRPLAARRLLGAALRNLQFEASLGLSWSQLTRADFAACQAADEDVEGIVNFVHGVEDALVGVLFRESEDGDIRVSLRASPPVDVGRFAQAFNGGGHALAAGCRLTGSLTAVRQQILPALREVLVQVQASS